MEASTRHRRGSAEIDRLILQTARDLFSELGYTGTSLREVAERAGVHEPMVRRRYGTKAALFEAAVLDPLDGAVTRYLQVQAAQVDAAGPTEDLTRSWVPPLYEVLRGERKLIFALMAAGEYHPDDLGESFNARVERIVARMLPQARLEIERRSMPGISLPENIIVSVGMLLGVALLDAERGFGLASDRLVEEMIQMTLYGVTARRGGTGSPGGSVVEAAGPEADRLLDRLLDRLAASEGRAARAELERDLLQRRVTELESQ